MESRSPAPGASAILPIYLSWDMQAMGLKPALEMREEGLPSPSTKARYLISSCPWLAALCVIDHWLPSHLSSCSEINGQGRWYHGNPGEGWAVGGALGWVGSMEGTEGSVWEM